MLSVKDDDVKESVLQETGIRPPFALEGFPDPDHDVRQSNRAPGGQSLYPEKGGIRRFVYEVESGRLREVTRP